MENLEAEKARLRQRMRELRGGLAAGQSAEASERMRAHLQRWETLLAARTLLGSLPMGGEIDARGLCLWWLAESKRLALPRVEPDGVSLAVWEVPDLSSVAAGYRGCPEPDPARGRRLSAAEVDVALIPGLAFDRRGHRLGQGGGHFDRWLAEGGERLVAVGLAFDFQVVESVPAASKDHRVAWLATPSGLHRCGQMS